MRLVLLLDWFVGCDADDIVPQVVVVDGVSYVILKG